MIKYQDVFIILSVIAASFIGVAVGNKLKMVEVKNNTVSGYHCAKIVKVKTLEEAKAIVEAHQKRIGG